MCRDIAILKPEGRKDSAGQSVRKERKQITHEEVAMWINMVQDWDADAKEGGMHGTTKCKIKKGGARVLILRWCGWG